MRRVRKAKEPQKVKVELTWSMIVGSWGVIYWEGSAFRSWLFIPLCGKNRTEGHNTNKNTLTKKSQNAFRPILQYLQWSFQVWFKIQTIFCWIVLQLQFNLWCTIPCRIYDMSVLSVYIQICVLYLYIFFKPVSCKLTKTVLLRRISGRCLHNTAICSVCFLNVRKTYRTLRFFNSSSTS